jgi:hypothetical protein
MMAFLGVEIIQSTLDIAVQQVIKQVLSRTKDDNMYITDHGTRECDVLGWRCNTFGFIGGRFMMLY